MNATSRAAWILLVGLLALSLQGCAATWTTDYPAAAQQARKQHKLILLNFTGSDWCGWCIKLEREVFSTRQFQGYANQHFALVEVDFPERKPQSDALKKRNKELAKSFDIEGYPTIIVLNEDGTELGRLGYVKGGPTPFIDRLDKLRTNKRGATNERSHDSP